MIRRRSACRSLLPCIAVSFFITSGCLSIDNAPLRQQPFFHKTEDSLRRLDTDPPVFPEGPFRIGAAKVDMTPPIGVPLAGYGARTSTGILHPLMARAVAVSNGHETVILLSLELLAITDDLFEAIYQRISAVVPLRRQDLLVAATHTHSGPGSLGRRFWESIAAGPFNERLFERTAQRAAEAAVGAWHNLRPGRVSHFRTESRDLIQNRLIPGGPTDPELNVMIFVSEQGERIATLINFSAHPTLLRSTNRLIAGDFPSVVSRVLEEDPGGVVLYTSGSVADQRARSLDADNAVERTERMGRELAQRVRIAFPETQFRREGSVGSISLWIDLPPPQIKVGKGSRLPLWLGRGLLDGKTRLQVIRIDRTLLLAVPGDLGSEIGMDLKTYTREKGLDGMIIGLANDYIGYVLPEATYRSAAYEASMAFNGPYMAEYLTLVLKAMIHRVQPGPPSPSGKTGG